MAVPPTTCAKWCDGHEDTWAAKCGWPKSCGGCAECATGDPAPAAAAPTKLVGTDHCETWCPLAWSKSPWAESCSSCAVCATGDGSQQLVAAASEGRGCPAAGSSGVFSDMHDGDEKTVSFGEATLTITPHGGNQSWTVTAPLDRAHCNASVDFNVPGKADFPPCAIGATVHAMDGGAAPRFSVEFTDPLGCLLPGKPTYPINSWLQVPSE